MSASLYHRRSPRGERGLKFSVFLIVGPLALSLPSRGAWIEMSSHIVQDTPSTGRSPRGERGLKWRTTFLRQNFKPSLPSRGAWIEMPFVAYSTAGPLVAPLAGSVD